MKITARKDLTSPQVGGLGAVRRGFSLAAPAPAADDVVSVSEAAREMALLHIEVGNPNLVRAEKVSGLRAVMAKGQYSADVNNVAGDFLRELLGELLS